MKLDDQSLAKVLRTTLETVDFELKKLEAKGYPRERLVQFIANRIGATAPAQRSAQTAQPSSGNDLENDRRTLMEALQALTKASPPGALLSIRELRSRTSLGKREFDDAAISLSNEGQLIMHHTDTAGAMSDAERYLLVRDSLGRHYVGIALPRQR